MILRAPLFSIYHLEMTNNIKMMIVKNAMGVFKDLSFLKNNFT
jgi:hypothetical protein